MCSFVHSLQSQHFHNICVKRVSITDKFHTAMITQSPTTGSVVVIDHLITGCCNRRLRTNKCQRHFPRQLSTERYRTPDTNTDGKEKHKHLQQTQSPCYIYRHSQHAELTGISGNAVLLINGPGYY